MMYAYYYMPTEIATASLAYVGPGSGFAISISFLTAALAAFGLVAVVVLAPLSSLWSLVRRRGRRRRGPYRRAVVLGLDGLDPQIVRRMMAEGRLPHAKRLAEQGTFAPLRSSMPAISPSVWSSFAVCGDASRHNIYDFIRCRRDYGVSLSSCEIVPPRRRLRLGRWQLPLGRAAVRPLRKGAPFWHQLAEAGLEVAVLRVPITFPPEPFAGRLLSGMCVPDIRGSQGTYTYYATADFRQSGDGGRFVPLEFRQGLARCELIGPDSPLQPGAGPLRLPLELRRAGAAGCLELRLPRQRLSLAVGQGSPWVTLRFRCGPLTIRGMVQVYLKACDENRVELYASPIQMDPAAPPMTISHPRLFAGFLAARHGPFGTLGLLEDTAALNDGALDERGFLSQAWQRFDERRRAFFDLLDERADDLVVCVFDTPDRIQHMFWRQTEPDHPANRSQPAAAAPDGNVANAIERAYIEADKLIGETMARLGDEALLLVISDHGFTSFRRQVDLNAWLLDHGYLHLLPGRDGASQWLADVDWSRTRAFAVGLTGIYVNLRGRQTSGIVAAGAEQAALLAEIAAGLESLGDDGDAGSAGGGDDGLAAPRRAVRRVRLTGREFEGPYTVDGPDLLVGYEAGYRCSWGTARGQVGRRVFSDNTRRWSGDHCVDAEIVPGVLLSNARLNVADPGIIDIGPTLLDLFGVPAGRRVQGRSLLLADAQRGPAVAVGGSRDG